MLAAAAGGEIGAERIDGGRLGLCGHSRGGAAAILAASQPRWRESIRALVTWAAISRVDRFTADEKRRWREAGELPVVNSRTGQQLALGGALLDDVERHGNTSASTSWRPPAGSAPWLIVHGEADETVPASRQQR